MKVSLKQGEEEKEENQKSRAEDSKVHILFFSDNEISVQVRSSLFHFVAFFKVSCQPVLESTRWSPPLVGRLLHTWDITWWKKGRGERLGME